MDELTRLFVDARDGDRLALASAIRATQADVWRFAAGLVGRADADDVTQDVYLRMFRSLPRFRAESSARTWLLVIARRACVDVLRRRSREQRRASAIGADGRELAVAGPDGSVPLDAMVGALARERRDAFVLTQMLGCSYSEAAAICDVPVGTIRSRVARAREDLVSALGTAEAV
ncbi:MAG: sigma-70 family RNA polymerase sigma factor [Actinobacteria bacterium]|nr:sigma-70 family RNA polymerase sigma factor [Actinomycetota bacterium]